MYMLRLFPLILSLLAFSVISFNTEARDVKIQVAATGDVHARLFPYNFVANKPAKTSMANVHYIVQSIRSQDRSKLILLDNGDLIQGSPAAYYANFIQDAEKNLFSRVMNFMKFDAATIGNHDIEAGPEVYNRLEREFDFPWLGANVIDKETGEPYFPPYTIIERQRIKIAVLGLTTTGVPQWLPAHLWEGLEFQDMVESAAEWVDHIREHEDVDAIVGLFHSGLGPLEPDPSDHPLEHASGYVAKEVPGFDVIFSAHDHRRHVRTIVNRKGDEVLLLGPGHFAENLAVAELSFSRTSRHSYELKDVRAEMIDTDRAVPSHQFIQEFDDDVQEILRFSNQKIAEISEPMHSIESFFGSAAFTDLVHDIQLKLTDADLSFTAPLAFNETIQEGTMYMRDFFSLYEYENYLYTMTLSGREILDYLEYSYGLWMNTMQEEDDYLLNFYTDELGRVPPERRGRSALRNPPYNFDSAAGITYVVDVTQPVGQRIEITGMEDDTPFYADSTYTVAINSYRGSGGGGHLTDGAGIPEDELEDRIVNTSDEDLRTKMIDYFKEIEIYHPEKRNNWKIIPEEYAEQGQENDKQYLIP